MCTGYHDYVPGPYIVKFKSGAYGMQSFNVTIHDDIKFENNETILLSIANSTADNCDTFIYMTNTSITIKDDECK